MGWYVVHTYSGYENKVKANIEKAIENRHLENEILEVRVPLQDVMELKNGVENTSDEEEEKNGLAFRNMQEAYESLKSDERGSRARTTKEGFLHHIFVFLENQGLIEYVQEDEMIKTTKKLDNFMDWNLLNQNNYGRVLRILGGKKDE